MVKKFHQVKAAEENPLWGNFIHREQSIYTRPNDIRNDFERDYTRLLHSNGYRRLKTKTQVFYATNNDHICTRIEHVNHVASISTTIAKELGLNVDLVSAIALGHDIGHAPFGHHGEKVLKGIAKEYLSSGYFWHEKNSLFFIDNIETLPDGNGGEKNLNLSYAVRDGIISHCGEVNDNAIRPREEFLNLDQIAKPNQYQPYSWEACVVKISDKIAYLGRDIEDAILFKILGFKDYRELVKILNACLGTSDLRVINNGILIHNFIIDLCENSSPETGIKFSPKYLDLINQIKQFNYNHIYNYWRLGEFEKYATTVLTTVFDTLMRFYNEKSDSVRLTISRNNFQLLSETFEDWLIKYSDYDLVQKKKKKYSNHVIYTIDDQDSFVKCCIHFISGMTDNFALKVFNEIISF